MYLIILVILISELITVSNGEDNYYVSDCNSQFNPHYMNNIVAVSVISEFGNTFKIENGMNVYKHAVVMTHT